MAPKRKKVWWESKSRITTQKHKCKFNSPRGYKALGKLRNLDFANTPW